MHETITYTLPQICTRLRSHDDVPPWSGTRRSSSSSHRPELTYATLIRYGVVHAVNRDDPPDDQNDKDERNECDEDPPQVARYQGR